jgi:hypothetical protein
VSDEGRFGFVPVEQIREGRRRLTPEEEAERIERMVLFPEDRAQTLSEGVGAAEELAAAQGLSGEEQIAAGERFREPFDAPTRKAQIGGEPGILQDIEAVGTQLARSLSPRVVETDRPKQLSEAARELGEDVAAASALRPLVSEEAEGRRQAQELQAGQRNVAVARMLGLPIGEGVDEELRKLFPAASRGDEGIPVESLEQSLLNTFAGFTQNVITEYLAAAPTTTVKTKGGEEIPLVPGPVAFSRGKDLVQRLQARLAADEDPVAVLRDELSHIDLGSVRFEKALLGTTPEGRGTLHDLSLEKRGKAVRPLLRALESTDQGFGMAELLEASAKTPEVLDTANSIAGLVGLGVDEERFARAAWWAGLAGDVLIPWEAPVAKLGSTAARAGRVVKDVPGASRANAFVKLLSNNESSLARDLSLNYLHPLADAEPDMGLKDAFDLLPETTRGILEERLDDMGMEIEEIRPPRAEPEAEVPLPEGDGVAARVARAEAQKAGAEKELTQNIQESIRKDASAALQRLQRSAGGEIGAQSDEEFLLSLRRGDIPTSFPVWLDRFFRFQASEFGFSKGIPIDERRVLRPYSGQESTAGEFLKGLHPDQKPTDLDYRLVDRQGRVVKDGVNLEQAHAELVGRRNIGDQVWYRDERPVAGWHNVDRKFKKMPETRDSEIKRHFRASTKDEAKLIGALSGKSERSVMPHDEYMRQVRNPLDSFTTAGAGLGGGDRLRSALHRRLMGMPDVGPLKRPPTPKEAAFIRALEDSLRLQMRDNGNLVRLMGNTYLPRNDAEAVMARIEKAKTEAGYKPASVSFFDSPTTGQRMAKLGKQHAAAERFFARMGVAESIPETVPVDELNRLSSHVVQKTAGWKGRAHYALKGTSSVSDAIVDRIAGDPGALVRAGRLTSKVIPEKMLRLMPKHVRDVVEDAMRELESVGPEMLDDFRAFMRKKMPNGANPTREEAINHLMPEYNPVTDFEAGFVEAFEASPPTTAVAIIARRSELADNVKGLAEYPDLFSHDYKVVKKALRRYVKHTRERARHLGTLVLKSALPPGQADDLITSFAGEDKLLPAAQMVRLWHGFLRNGFDAQEIKDAIADLQTRPIKLGALPDNTRAMDTFVIRLRQEETMKRVARKLLEQEVGTASPSTLRAINALLGGGKPDDWASADAASRLLNKWGLGPSFGGAFAKFGDAALPQGVVDELIAAAARGVRFPGKPEGVLERLGDASSGYMRMYKWLLTDVNPGFHVANWVSIPFIALQQLGGRDALRAASVLMKDEPAMVSEITSRLTPGPASTLLGRTTNLVETAAGNIYDADDIEKMVRRLGVGETFRGSMTSEQITSELDRLSGEWVAFNRWRLKGAPADAAAAASQTGEALRSISEVPERAFRISTFIDHLKRGASPEEAAAVARNSLFDYTKLTDFDRRVMRQLVVFWTFHRKNIDSFLDAVGRHPERVGAILRFARSQRGIWDEEDRDPVRLSRLRPTDLARVVMGPGLESADGRDVELSTTSAITPAEAMFFLTGLLSGDTYADLLGQTNPLIAAPLEVATRVAPGTGRRVDDPMENIIPDYLVNTPGLSTLGHAFGAQRHYLDPDQFHMAVGEDPNGPYVFVASKPRRAAWRLFSRSFGGGRFMGSTVPGFHRLTKPEEDLPASSSKLLDQLAALGLRAKPKLPAEEQMDVLRTRDVGAITAATRDVQQELR